MTFFSFVLPVYNNRETLLEVYSRVLAIFESYYSSHLFELIFVNDGSKDDSLEVLRGIKSDTGDSRIRIINLSRNFGQMAATMAGLRMAKGDAVVYLAADLQDPPEQCIPMFNELISGNDVVVSYRNSHGQSFSRKITSNLFYRFFLPGSPKGGFDFVLMNRKALDAFLSFKERNRFGQYDILNIGFRLKFIPYEKLRRPIGKSQSNFFKRFSTFLTLYINTSYFPLRMMTIIGMVFSVSGFIYAALIVWSYFVDETPFVGWAPIMILILITGGLIMMMLGVLGEYIWRILDEVKGRPLFFIENEY